MKKLILLVVLVLTMSACVETPEEAEEFTITFHSDGGTAIDDVVVEEGNMVQIPTVPSKEGFEFDGWYMDSALSAPFNFASPVIGDINLYAKWETNEFTLKFVDYDESIIYMESYLYGDDLTSIMVNNPEREGYTFDGWDDEVPDTMPNDDLSLSAIYTINNFTVSFVDFDGTLLLEEDFDYGEEVVVDIPAEPIRAGYTFVSWNMELPETMPNDDLTLSPIYTINNFSVSYVDFDGTLLLEEEFEYGQDIVVDIPANPMRVGYTFDGWSEELPSTMPNDDIEIVATYTINTYMISYIDYDGTVLATDEFEYGEDIVFATPTDPERVGYTFIEWSSDLPTTMPGENLVIETIYEIKTFIMTFVDYDGSWLSSQEFEYGELFENILKPIPSVREGYTFEGWDNTLVELTVEENITVTAVFSINSYVLRFLDYDGTVLNTYEFDFEEGILVAVSNPVRDGYTFIGWDMNVPLVMPSQDLDITAMYIGERQETYDDAVPNDSFGLKTYAAGDYIVVSSYAPNSWKGMVWVYKQSDPTYYREIEGVDTTADSYFGEYVLIHGDYLVVRSAKHDSDTGAIWVYKFSDETYERKITSSDAEIGDHFALNVKLHDDYIIALSFTTNDTYTGSVYLYKFSDETYERKIVGAGATANSRFGQLIVMSEDYLFVGALSHDAGTGRVWVYKFSDQTYERIISCSAAAQSNYFGRSLVVAGDYIAIGSDGFQTGRGAVWVYKISDTSYERLIVGTGTDDYDYFGQSIDKKDDYLIVNTARYGADKGAVFLYKFNDDSYERVITGLNTSNSDFFGFNYTIEGDYLVVNSYNFNNNQGAVWLYKFSDETYERLIVGSTTVAGSRFGNSVIIKDDYIIVSNPAYNDYQGAVWIYKISDVTYERIITWGGLTPSLSFGQYMYLFNDLLVVTNQAAFGDEANVILYSLTDEDYEIVLSGAATEDNQYYGFVIVASEDYLIVTNYRYDEGRGKIYIYELS